MEDLKSYIREVPDFPKPGINFYDITTLLKDPLALRMTVDRFTWLFSNGHRPHKVVGIESRGFMFAPSLAYNLNAGFVPVRKPGKLPAKTVSQSYDLEYGNDRLEMHADAVAPGEKVLIVDGLDIPPHGGEEHPSGRCALLTGRMVNEMAATIAIRSGAATASTRSTAATARARSPLP